MKKWSMKELEKNIQTNVIDYGAIVVVAYLFKKIYGRLPKCGMSGMQAEFADGATEQLPDKDDGEPEFIKTMDARDWEEGLNKVLVKNGGEPIDPGLLIGWFANALMYGYDKGNSVRGSDE